MVAATGLAKVSRPSCQEARRSRGDGCVAVREEQRRDDPHLKH